MTINNWLILVFMDFQVLKWKSFGNAGNSNSSGANNSHTTFCSNIKVTSIQNCKAGLENLSIKSSCCYRLECNRLCYYPDLLVAFVLMMNLNKLIFSQVMTDEQQQIFLQSLIQLSDLTMQLII